ncbi:MAG: GNAT family N-acetyltransferase [Muribaculaceae bacterium]|nr:GNAT family N-acetyltransferase [Muribaculaceae bacterium]
MENIREVRVREDSDQLATIYSWYVENTTATFELIPLTNRGMLLRIEQIAAHFPFFVWEEEGVILGYCYAHKWKCFLAYDITLETTIYLRPDATGKGIGGKLMGKLIEECRRRGFVSLIACITAENEGSCRFHESLGFKKVSFFRNVGQKFGRMLDVADYQLLLDSSVITTSTRK